MAVEAARPARTTTREPITVLRGGTSLTVTAEQPIYAALMALLHPRSVAQINSLTCGKAAITLDFGPTTLFRLGISATWTAAEGAV